MFVAYEILETVCIVERCAEDRTAVQERKSESMFNNISIPVIVVNDQRISRLESRAQVLSQLRNVSGIAQPWRDGGEFLAERKGGLAENENAKQR